MLKKILRKRVIIPLIIILIASSIGIYVYRYYKNSITGEDRFLCEMMFMDELAEITEQLDTTISLYYNGNLNEDAYITQMQMIDDEMLIFMDRKKKFDDNVVVRLNTNTLASKKGTEAAHNIFNTFDGLVDSCMNETY